MLRRRFVGSTVATIPAVASRGVSTLIPPERFEGPLDLQAKKTNRGPPVAHSLPVYKTAHKLNSSARWKKANAVTNVGTGTDYRLRETQQEGKFDETGEYRDWLYGDERRYANWFAIAALSISGFTYWYTMRTMRMETWEIPTPLKEITKKRKDRDDTHAIAESVMGSKFEPIPGDISEVRNPRPATIRKASF